MTPEIRDATEKVEHALTELFALMGMDSQSQIGDWMVISSTPLITTEGDLHCGYFMAYSQGALQEHVALGLVAKANQIMNTWTED